MTTNEDTVEACPECDSSRLMVRRQNPETPRYKCRMCKSEFDTARVREKKYGGNRVGLAGELDDMNPSDL